MWLLLKITPRRKGYSYFQNILVYYSISKTFLVFVVQALCYTVEKNLLKPWSICLKKEEWQKGISFGSFNKQITYDDFCISDAFPWVAFHFLFDIISHENCFFQRTWYYRCNRILRTSATISSPKGEKVRQEVFKKDPAPHNLWLSFSEIYKVFLPELDP